MRKKPATKRRDEVKAGIGNDPAFAYSALPGVADEMVDNTGAVRPVWQNLLAALSRMPEQELLERFARADRYLRDAGVFYRAYGAKGLSERNWPISHIPVLIDEREWQTLSEGQSPSDSVCHSRSSISTGICEIGQLRSLRPFAP